MPSWFLSLLFSCIYTPRSFSRVLFLSLGRVLLLLARNDPFISNNLETRFSKSIYNRAQLSTPFHEVSSLAVSFGDRRFRLKVERNVQTLSLTRMRFLRVYSNFLTKWQFFFSSNMSFLLINIVSFCRSSEAFFSPPVLRVSCLF